MQNNPRPGGPLDLKGCQNLMVAVIKSANDDLVSREMAARESALRYFASDDFEMVCEFLQSDYEMLMRGLDFRMRWARVKNQKQILAAMQQMKRQGDRQCNKA